MAGREAGPGGSLRQGGRQGPGREAGQETETETETETGTKTKRFRNRDRDRKEQTDIEGVTELDVSGVLSAKTCAHVHPVRLCPRCPPPAPSTAAPHNQGWQGRTGSQTCAPRPATVAQKKTPRPATPCDPGLAGVTTRLPYPGRTPRAAWYPGARANLLQAPVEDPLDPLDPQHEPDR